MLNIALGMLVLSTGYHFYIWAHRTKEKYNLYYALYCFSLSIMLVDLKYVRPHLNTSIEFLFINHLVASMKTLFLSYCLDRKKVLIIVYSLLSLMLPFGYFIHIRVYSFTLSLYGIFFIFFVLYNLIFQRPEDRKKLLILFAFIINLLLLTVTIVSRTFFHSIGAVMYSVLSLSAIIFSFYIARIFNEEYKALEDLRSNLEKQVEDRTAELHQQKEANKNMYVNFAHEIKTILSIMKMTLDSFKKNSWEESLGKIREQVDKLTKDVLNFLNASQIERKEFSYSHDKAVDVSAFLKRYIKIYGEALEKKGTLILKSKIQKDLYIQSDVMAIDRVITNLIENALKYTEKGSIQIELKEVDSRIMLIIRDTGIGIKKENIPRIFDFSYRGELAVKSCKSGYGMGLGMVKNIVESLQGDIEVDSDEGYGSTFTVTIPAYIPVPGEPLYNSPVTEIKMQPSNKENLKRTKRGNLPCILLVDDNEDLRTILQKELADDFIVITAEHGQAALDKLAAMPPPEIIISDRMMPVMDGDEFFKATRKHYSHIPFIFLSAKGGYEDKIDAVEKGAVDYLPKPFDLRELEVKLNSHIALRSAAADQDNRKRKIKLDDSAIEDIRKAVLLYAGEYDLSTREIQVAVLIVSGKRNKEIADELATSENNVAKIRSRLINKLPFKHDVKNPDRYDFAGIFGIM